MGTSVYKDIFVGTPLAMSDTDCIKTNIAW